MVRTKQTTRAGARGGKPAAFPWGRAPVLAGGGPAPGTFGANGAPNPAGDQDGKAPHGRAPTR